MRGLLVALNIVSLAVAAFLVFANQTGVTGNGASSVSASMAGAPAPGVRRFAPQR
ncbi:hypothetical protein GGQ64_000100 [Rhizobium azooxidifex]|uniref:Uncharacterized protein n=1 Tax=Mycoplana azooxidifex TaxID=1636188 RepID=A0A7W6D9T5_9HYPH|nr:hypothetical protein [Mycoplana azooxidifex]MBB3974924.1 hypothetical protein [Mycoplana azooxidifex]